MLRQGFRAYMSMRERNTARIIVGKTLLYEWASIMRKRPIWSRVKWGRGQREEFDTWWLDNYGHRIPTWWHRYYEALSGVCRVDYIPDHIYCSKIEPMLNDYTYTRVLEDKCFTPWVLPPASGADVRYPSLLGVRTHGMYLDACRSATTRKKLAIDLSNAGRVICKVCNGSSSGEDVAILDIHEGIDVRSGRSVLEILSDSQGRDLLIQECVHPHEAFEWLYPHSINTVRVTTYVLEGTVRHVPLILRMGAGSSEVDNSHAGGLFIAVDDDGTLAERAYRLDGRGGAETFSAHPDTGIAFEGYRLPKVGRIIREAKRMHTTLPRIGIVSWDMTLDEAGRVVLIEANLKGQTPWFQMAYAQSMFKDDAADMLRMTREG